MELNELLKTRYGRVISGVLNYSCFIALCLWVSGVPHLLLGLGGVLQHVLGLECFLIMLLPNMILRLLTQLKQADYFELYF